MQEILKAVVDMFHELEKLSKQLVVLFNNHTGVYDGDPLFQPTTSPICKHWVPRKDEEDLFMNYNCNHPDADCGFADTDHCSIMSCSDEKYQEEIAGIIAAMHNALHPIHTALVGEIFNGNKHLCEYYEDNGSCAAKKFGNCYIVNCPL